MNQKNENELALINGVLNGITQAAFILDVDDFTILLANDQMKKLIGDKVNHYCYNVFCTKGLPCLDCPLICVPENETIETKYFSDIYDSYMVERISNIPWYDGRRAVLSVILNSDEIIERNRIQNLKDKELQYQNELKHQAEYDGLTGLPNTRRFMADVKKKMAENQDEEYAIVVFDIDRFKMINDLFDMSVGDEVLKFIADTLNDVLPKEDCRSRLYSDVFCFCTNYTTKGKMIQLVEKVNKAMKKHDFDFDFRLSFGIYLPKEKNIPVNLMCDRAALACRQVKSNVMQFCAFYDEQYRSEMIKAREIEQDMTAALENKEYIMYLQPKYSLRTGDLVGAEVLARWFHPQKGLIQPNDFIPLFEKNGFILKLDEFMWEQACKTLRHWIDEGRRPLPLSVNISRYHIQHNDLEKVLCGLIEKYDLKPDMLILEITETMFSEAEDVLYATLSRLQSLGFRLEVDDFGSGYSSLNMLRNAAVDTIKLDKDFLDQRLTTPKGKIVVKHTIALAKELRLSVVAEGVETSEHVQFLKSSSCDIAQGYFFAKPMPLEDFNKLEF